MNRIRQYVIDELLFSKALMDMIDKYRDFDDIGSQMIMYTSSLLLEMGKKKIVMLLLIDLAIRHPNWDKDRCKTFISDFCKKYWGKLGGKVWN